MTKGLRTEIEHIIIKYPKDLNIMCRLRKTAVFEFFVSKLIGLDLAKIKEMTSGEIDEFNKKLSDYSMTRYMKLLYFLCLVDAGEGKKGGEGETKSGEKLLSIFDNFVAYRNGPIEDDIYLNRENEGEFTHFIFEEGCLKLRQKSDLSLLPEMVENADQKAVDKALEELEKCQIGKTCQEKSVLQQTDTVLVDLSHEVKPRCLACRLLLQQRRGKNEYNTTRPRWCTTKRGRSFLWKNDKASGSHATNAAVI
ncbi:hypothetical protein PGTDC60_1042 [Porphyromonas gingivalis TDC60]|uniref:hypothetical protein n=1 Tax=Porphyromonas gingivalis TaxID=837 RepID=UPI00020EFFA8|nr:hypothetical protein [Porphyromonas gingivalis]AUR48291.1 hypothetical protein CF002_1042 [Porphyromonas gingivalis]BAK25199.1 hypothetical protein PGTDC60_1042 [Porphyromonas gingivalis TDC60]